MVVNSRNSILHYILWKQHCINNEAKIQNLHSVCHPPSHLPSQCRTMVFFLQSEQALQINCQRKTLQVLVVILKFMFKQRKPRGHKAPYLINSNKFLILEPLNKKEWEPQACTELLFLSQYNVWCLSMRMPLLFTQRVTPVVHQSTCWIHPGFPHHGSTARDRNSKTTGSELHIPH